MKKLLLISFITLLTNWAARAQGDAGLQLWTDATFIYDYKPKWSVGGDAGYRFNSRYEFQQTYIRPRIRFRATKVVNFNAGMAFFYTWNLGSLNSYEFRTFEYMFIYWPTVWGVKFSHRIGLDQRWFFLPVFQADEFVHRFRYRLRLRSPQFTVMAKNSPFYLSFELELLRNINAEQLSTFFDNDRITFALGNRLHDKIRLELHYMLVNGNEPTMHKFIRKFNVLRFKVFYTI